MGILIKNGTVVTASERTIPASTRDSRCDRNIFEGFRVKGRPSYGIVNGRVQFEDGELEVERGAGWLLKRQPSGAIPVPSAARVGAIFARIGDR